ncbi:hypothetical protein EG68_06604 [Paragonimus skrjabini miyazakii]|uniref:DUF5738 domain-containing protein n=1 Tax=Paragonimus skrjabini miyazakii TaxID=59628 RepID=A0A8S9YSF2_9TREM|nr:hypothetical protein EG68_06604 [Paragonimus skrjabini miyazakii]
MAHLYDVLNVLDSEPIQSVSQQGNALSVQPINLSQAPSPNMFGSNTQCGSAIATEIDAYRRRIQTLLHFFDCIAQHWWDHLYPYKRNLIKRPSKSADEVRSYQSRLLARLNKFTMRTVVPAAAAIATMEAHASVKVLPKNLLSSMSVDLTHSDIPFVVDNSDALLHKACNLARRLGDIEKLKQRLILSALTWITSDGRDFALRAQRIALLARHAEPCLIEHFAGVRALLTHYYRPRILVQKQSDRPGSSNLVSSRFEPITATRLTTTNEQIAEAIESVYPRANQYSTNSGAIGSENTTDELQPSLSFALWQDLSRTESKKEVNELVSPSTTLMNPDSMLNLSGSQISILPSIVLNPLSIDTSQLDWLSYEINQRDLNLHVLNTEEPEDTTYQLSSRSSFLPPTVRASLESVPDISMQANKLVDSRLISRIPTKSIDSQRAVSEKSLWTTGTPITTPNSKESGWSVSSRDSNFSELDDSRPNWLHALADERRQLNGLLSSSVSTRIRSKEEISMRYVSHTSLAAHGEKLLPFEQESLTLKSEYNATTAQRGTDVISPGGKGEEPSSYLIDTHHEESSINSLHSKPTQEYVKNETKSQSINLTAEIKKTNLPNIMVTTEGTNMNQPVHKKNRHSRRRQTRAS